MNGVRTIADGMPTAPDVKLIREHYPDNRLEEGTMIATKEEIAKIIMVDVESHRFKTVTGAWRRSVERETGKVIKLVNGEFNVLDDSGKLVEVGGGLRSAAKKIRRVKTVGSYIARRNLSDDERNRYDLVNYRMSKMLEADRLAAKSYTPSLTDGTETKGE
jgi:hypothetical protein